jgi:hypothetical protein
MRSCLASKEIAKVARFLSFILLLKLMLIQLFPRKTFYKTKKQNILLLHSSEICFLFENGSENHVLWADMKDVSAEGRKALIRC